MRKVHQAVLEFAGREVVITNPDKPFFPQAGHTKLHLVRYYAAVAEGALRGIAGRPIVLKRYVDGAAGEPFFQKRAPEQRPEWIETVELRFPSGLLWMVNLGCIDLNPHPVRADDLEHPDELRVDLGGTARARPREQQMVEGGTPRGLPRLPPERQGPDRGLGLVGAAHARRARVDAF
jgi:DNA primase